MRIPNADQAIIDDEKLTGYLLSDSHRSGGAKAAFFSSFGFSLACWTILRDALLEHISYTADDAVATETPFGTSYVCRGPLTTPSGRKPDVKVVWFIRTGEDVPRLLTAVPSKRRRQ